jgi:hypothetical protein
MWRKNVSFGHAQLTRGGSERATLRCAAAMRTSPATFHANGCVNRPNYRIWASEQPNEIHEYVRGSAKVNVWCGLLCDRVAGPFFFTESTITGDIYLDLLQLYVCPQIEYVEREKLGTRPSSCRTEHLPISACLCAEP